MYPQLAGNDSTVIAAPAQIFAGSAEVTTNRAQGGTNVKLAALTVIALVGDKIVQYNPAGSDGSEVAAGILAAPLTPLPQPALLVRGHPTTRAATSITLRSCGLPPPTRWQNVVLRSRRPAPSKSAASSKESNHDIYPV